MSAAGIASLLVAIVALGVAAYLLPGRLRALAIVTVVLGILPFWDGALGAMDLAANILPVSETWRAAILASLVLLLAGGVTILLATTRSETLWPIAALPVLAGIVVPSLLDASALVAAVALPTIVRGGFGDPTWWRRIGSGISMLLLIAVNVLIAISITR